jgi:hypothetical protein
MARTLYLNLSTSVRRYLAVAVFTCLAPFASAGPITLDIQPSLTYAGNGDSVSLDLVVSGLGDFSPDSLGAFDISVGFDASVLSLNNYALGDFLGDVALAQAIDASAGDFGGGVNIAEVSLLSVLDLDALQPESFTLATLNFDVINLGLGATTQLSVLQGAILGDAYGVQLPVAGFGTASISNVPLPGTLLLIIASCFGWRLARQACPLPRS